MARGGPPKVKKTRRRCVMESTAWTASSGERSLAAFHSLTSRLVTTESGVAARAVTTVLDAMVPVLSRVVCAHGAVFCP